MVRRKRGMKIKRQIYLRVDPCVGTPVDELKGHFAGYAEKEEINWTGILTNGYKCGHAAQ